MDVKDEHLKSVLFFTVISLGCDSLIIFLFSQKKSNYIILLKTITIIESAFIFSKFLFCITITNKNIFQIFQNFFKKLTFKEIDYIHFSNINEKFYFSSKLSCIILNIFLSIETIQLLKNPFSQVKKRKFSYETIGFMLITINFILYSIFFKKLEIYFLLIEKILYLILILAGCISLILLFIRFCLNNPLFRTFRKMFVFRQCSYVLINSFLFFLEIYYNDNESKKINSLSTIFVLSIGLILFLSRLTEIFLSKTKKFQTNDKFVRIFLYN